MESATKSTSCRFQSFINCLPVFCRHYHPFETTLNRQAHSFMWGQREDAEMVSFRFPLAGSRMPQREHIKLCSCGWHIDVVVVLGRLTSESNIMQIKLSNRSFSFPPSTDVFMLLLRLSSGCYSMVNKTIQRDCIGLSTSRQSAPALRRSGEVAVMVWHNGEHKALAKG